MYLSKNARLHLMVYIALAVLALAEGTIIWAIHRVL